MMISNVVAGKDLLSGHEVRSVEVGCPYFISSAGVVVAAACSRVVVVVAGTGVPVQSLRGGR